MLDSNGIKISDGFDGLHFDKEHEGYIKVTNNSKKTTPSSLEGLLNPKGELVLAPIYAYIKVFPMVISAYKYNKQIKKYYSLFKKLTPIPQIYIKRLTFGIKIIFLISMLKTD